MQVSSTDGALADIRVIDLTRVLGGPYCTQILADHGADVIKVEPPGGDETRGWGPPFKDETASYYLGVNRNKRGIVLDLSQPIGRQALLGLLESADILIENFKTGTLEKWGIGYQDVLGKSFPRLIHCRISGFGADGPLGGLPGYDAAIQAMVGLMSVNGEPDGEPLRMGVPVVDIVTGLNATIGIMFALHERSRSGLGQFVETTLFDCGFSVLHPHLANFFLNGMPPVRTGNAHSNIAPYDTFQTMTKPIFLAVGNDSQFRRLCDIIGCRTLPEDQRYSSNARRVANRTSLKAELEARLTGFDCEQLADQLIRSGVPCGPVLGLDAVVNHPHTRHREMVVEVDGHVGTGSPIKLSRTKPRYRRAPPKLGEHNEEILGKRRNTE
jgi:crotonobetainyl-CoA:carnitine CoA-transferase CaiB-like acyl-CoA transferase